MKRDGCEGRTDEGRHADARATCEGALYCKIGAGFVGRGNFISVNGRVGMIWCRGM
jgi:hypothetical protein